MKRTAALLLALLFLFTFTGFSPAEETEGFEPAAVAAGMLRNVNAQLSNNVSLMESDTAGLYSVYYQAMDMGCYLNIGSSDPESGVNDKISVSEVFYYDANTAQTYLSFFLFVSAAAEQYATGEDFGTAVNALSEALSAAMNAEDGTFAYTAGTLGVTVGVQTGNGLVLLDLALLA